MSSQQDEWKFRPAPSDLRNEILGHGLLELHGNGSSGAVCARFAQVPGCTEWDRHRWRHAEAAHPGRINAIVFYPLERQPVIYMNHHRRPTINQSLGQIGFCSALGGNTN